ncbi:MAG: class I SAM-dependent methyltransferase [Methanoregulaceae archaeon]
MTLLREGYWREQWRQCKLARMAVPNYGNSSKFWGDKKKVHTSYMKGREEGRRTMEKRLEVLNIPDGSRILDIGAGPGPLAVPLAERGCQVTAVEPSPVMREALAEHMKERNVQNITVIPRRWEEVGPADLGEPFDVVIASYSLVMLDMGDAVAKMDAVAGGTVHLFWFLTSPGWAQVNRDLWPLLHGGHFPGEPTADWIWQILHEMGIHANLTVEPGVHSPTYASTEEAVQEFLGRLNCTTPAHEEILRSYLEATLLHRDNGYVLPGETFGAHIWWEKSGRKSCAAR